MRKAILALALTAATSYAASAGSATVLTNQLSLRSYPNGELTETVESGQSLELSSLFNFWGLSEKGWFGVDYTEFSFPKLLKTGSIELKLCTLNESLGTVKEGTTGVVAGETEDYYEVAFGGKLYRVPKSSCTPFSDTFSIEVVNFKATLKGPEGNRDVPSGTALLQDSSGRFFFKGRFYNSIEFPQLKGEVDREILLKEINRIIDIFNSAKFSSPLADRLGYYVKTLPVRNEDLRIVKTPNGVGVFVKLKYRFFTKEGKPIDDRKTRLFLKRSNFIFWKNLTQELFGLGVNKFVELDIYRFNGSGGYENCGFVASSYHFYRLYGFKNWRDFIDHSESNLSEDLWFFADQVYERVEGNGD